MRVQTAIEIRSYMKELQVVSATEPVLTEGKFLKVASANYTLANGHVIPREEIIKRNNDAAIILPVTTEGNIVLIIQPRPLTQTGVTIELPAGYIDKDERAKNAAIRELVEETGYVPADGIEEVGYYYQDQGCSRAVNKSYIAYGCEKVKDQKLDNDEYVKYFECTFDEMLELLQTGYITSANSMLTILLAQERVKTYIDSIKTKVKK